MPNSNSHEVAERLNELKSTKDAPENFSVSGKTMEKFWPQPDLNIIDLPIALLNNDL